MENITIKVYHTHIEVSPYHKGLNSKIEKYMSKWDSATHKYIDIGYFIYNDVLYLPRGINGTLLSNIFGVEPVIMRNYDNSSPITRGEGLLSPKSTSQENAINFLTSSGQYEYTNRFHQFGLNIDTGDGKTYAVLSSVLKMKLRTIIITNQTKIKNQWFKSIETMTSFPVDKVLDITGSEPIDKILDDYYNNIEVDYEIFLTTHQTLTHYGNTNGWDKITKLFKVLKVGFKVFDEAHKFFTSILMIDYFTNTYKTFYLTATFGRSDVKEEVIYKRAFQSLIRFGEETYKYKDKRKHIIFIVVYFKSKPEYGVTPSLKNAFGFSSYKYIDYELNEGTLLNVVKYIIDKIGNMEGRLLITSPKIDSAELIKKELNTKLNSKDSILTVHSHNSEDVNKYALNNANIISSTIKSIGVGTDIKGLRNFIQLEPMGSQVVASQVIGRLREYDSEKDTYFWYPVDSTIKHNEYMLNKILPVINKKCKDIKYIIV